MLSPGKAAALLLILLLAGCASGPNGRRAPGLDWQSSDAAPTSIVAPPGFPAHDVSPVNPGATNSGAPPSSSSHPAEFAGTWTALNRWCRDSGVGIPTQTAPPPTPAYSLTTSNGTLILHPGSQLTQWNGVEVRLGFQPQMINDQPYVHALDMAKTVKPLLLGLSPVRLETNSVIVIDPGHGGDNPGTSSVLDGSLEKKYTLDWGVRLQTYLQVNSCWKIVLTRTNDIDIALSNRVAFAETERASIFISLHFNSATPDPGQGGLETYCLTPAGLPSNLTRGPDDLSLAFPNNLFDGENLQLALQVHRSLLKVNNRDRSVRRARFPGVLRGQRCPAVLVEGGYLSNQKEARLIADPAYRQQLAEAVGRALLGLSAGNPHTSFSPP